jgi:hypothetical protein
MRYEKAIGVSENYPFQAIVIFRSKGRRAYIHTNKRAQFYTDIFNFWKSAN